jgi:DNA-nicking Smr family endonuclease
MIRKSKGLSRRPSEPELELDLHGYTKVEAEAALSVFFVEARRFHIHKARVITGWGVHSPFGRPILKEFVRDWLDSKNYHYREGHPEEGGIGVLIVKF